MKNKISIFFRTLTSVILLQTLYFKFSGAPESIYIFDKLGVEPWGRIFSGIVELIASVLLLIPATQLIGALLIINVMLGAILSHIFVLGIEIQDDHGLLFTLAFVCLTSSILILVLQKNKLKELIFKLKERFV